MALDLSFSSFGVDVSDGSLFGVTCADGGLDELLTSVIDAAVVGTRTMNEIRV